MEFGFLWADLRKNVKKEEFKKNVYFETEEEFDH